MKRLWEKSMASHKWKTSRQQRSWQVENCLAKLLQKDKTLALNNFPPCSLTFCLFFRNGYCKINKNTFYDSIPKNPIHQIRNVRSRSTLATVCGTDLSTWRFDWCCWKGEMTKSLVSFFWFICQTSFPDSTWKSRLERPWRGEKKQTQLRVNGAYSKQFWLAWRKWNLVESISIRRKSGSDAEGKQLSLKEPTEMESMIFIYFEGKRECEWEKA